VFAIGVNYRSHAAETGLELPTVPAAFTKFPACLAGPSDDVTLSGDTVDWEVELVAVIGQRADRVDEADGWAHVAGLTVGQDLSDRTLQFSAGGQYSLGKSYRGFGPMGPWLVTPAPSGRRRRSPRRATAAPGARARRRGGRGRPGRERGGQRRPRRAARS
jgi:2-keto-4-pentenoate hydratase/2-oxohepta-3-ene-1,7-dioic acid hydratase in catechol pathway